MSEVLTGIRVVKFYAWENNFIKKILGIRYVALCLRLYVQICNGYIPASKYDYNLFLSVLLEISS